MPKIFIDYYVRGTVEIEMNDESLSYLKDRIRDYDEERINSGLVIEERFAEEISQHIKHMATVEIEDWEIQE